MILTQFWIFISEKYSTTASTTSSMEDSPADCTGIFLMKKTYNELMNSPSVSGDRLATRLRFDEPESKRTRFNHSSRSTTSLSMANLLGEVSVIKKLSKITEKNFFREYFFSETIKSKGRILSVFVSVSVVFFGGYDTRVNRGHFRRPSVKYVVGENRSQISDSNITPAPASHKIFDDNF